jgi:hypothetical protein
VREAFYHFERAHPTLARGLLMSLLTTGDGSNVRGIE